MSVTPTDANQNPRDDPSPGSGEVGPLPALGMAVSLATAAGFLAGWPASVTVLGAVVSLFIAYRRR
ncbi:hypothetical protein [Antrihabitans spumae]|uniref:Uncharacterized protein n=1 Tax=Antrihabitans spumae TaxID=3373370 RepID=A0ABW7K7M3_9NOCA